MDGTNFRNAVSEPVRLAGAEGEHFFFGYYDIPAFSRDRKLHLAHKVSFYDRLQAPGDVCTLGTIDIATKKFTDFAQVKAWNFQQGTLLGWNPANSDEVIYNRDEGTEYISVRHNLKTGNIVKLPMAFAAISPNGRYGVTLNFDRVFDFRPGYGYCLKKDKYFDIPQPADDGVFLVDIENGSCKMILDYKTLGAHFGASNPKLKNAKIVINHVAFNAAGDRFVFLLRNFPTPEQPWITAIGTSDLDGNFFMLHDYTYASHLNWRDEKNLLIHSDCGEGRYLYLLEDMTKNYKIIAKNGIKKDIHCVYSPDKRYIMGDSYLTGENYRELFLVDTVDDSVRIIGKFKSSPKALGDWRCDLHALWNPDGGTISFDSTHDGYRGIYLMDVLGKL